MLTPQLLIVEDPDNLTADALPLLLVQIFVVLVFSRVFGRILFYFKQPAVIGEIIAGIILGPSVLGYASGWSTAIFPPASLNAFNLIANLGLILFMFYLGLELDPQLMKREWRTSVPIATSAIAVPFGIGALCAVLWWYDLNDAPSVNRTSFILFAGTSMSFTAFPVLASLLSHTKLLHDPIGYQGMGCAAVDDIMAWCVLAVASSFAAAGGDGLQGLYTTLLAIAYIVGMLFLIRPILVWIAHHAIATKNEYVLRNFTVGLFLYLLVSAFLSEIIGIHSFFGAFLAGLLVPKEGGFAYALAPKIELVVVEFFLPLYFTSSGLKTTIGSLNTGSLWGQCLAITAIAAAAKFIPAMLMTKWLTGKPWRFACTMGAIMNTRGLVELIALNIGLTSGILSQRLFTMLVIMAILTTVSTAPLLYYLYVQFLPETHPARLPPGAVQPQPHGVESTSTGQRPRARTKSNAHANGTANGGTPRNGPIAANGSPRNGALAASPPGDVQLAVLPPPATVTLVQGMGTADPQVPPQQNAPAGAVIMTVGPAGDVTNQTVVIEPPEGTPTPPPPRLAGLVALGSTAGTATDLLGNPNADLVLGNN